MVLDIGISIRVGSVGVSVLVVGFVVLGVWVPMRVRGVGVFVLGVVFVCG